MKASLAAIIIFALWPMLNFRIVLDMWRVSKLDLIPWAIAFFGSTFSTFTVGVGASCAVNALLLLFFSARPEFPDVKPERSVEVVGVTQDFTARPLARVLPPTEAVSPAVDGPVGAAATGAVHHGAPSSSKVALMDTVAVVRLGGRYVLVWSFSLFYFVIGAFRSSLNVDWGFFSGYFTPMRGTSKTTCWISGRRAKAKPWLLTLSHRPTATIRA